MVKAHRNVSMNFLTIWRTGDIVIRTLKAISIDQLAEFKVRQSIERQHLCIHIILTSVVSQNDCSDSPMYCIPPWLHCRIYAMLTVLKDKSHILLVWLLFNLCVSCIWRYFLRWLPQPLKATFVHSYYPNFGGLWHIIRVQLKHILIFPNYFPSLR
jgi:hypothetical protein